MTKYKIGDVVKYVSETSAKDGNRRTANSAYITLGETCTVTCQDNSPVLHLEVERPNGSKVWLSSDCVEPVAVEPVTTTKAITFDDVAYLTLGQQFRCVSTSRSNTKGYFTVGQDYELMQTDLDDHKSPIRLLNNGGHAWWVELYDFELVVSKAAAEQTTTAAVTVLPALTSVEGLQAGNWLIYLGTAKTSYFIKDKAYEVIDVSSVLEDQVRLRDKDGDLLWKSVLHFRLAIPTELTGDNVQFAIGMKVVPLPGATDEYFADRYVLGSAYGTIKNSGIGSTSVCVTWCNDVDDYWAYSPSKLMLYVEPVAEPGQATPQPLTEKDRDTLNIGDKLVYLGTLDTVYLVAGNLYPVIEVQGGANDRVKIYDKDGDGVWKSVTHFRRATEAELGSAKDALVPVTSANSAVGMRVVPGPHWSYGNQDAGTTGTITELSSGYCVRVRWDHGGSDNYVCSNIKQDLAVAPQTTQTDKPMLQVDKEVIKEGYRAALGRNTQDLAIRIKAAYPDLFVDTVPMTEEFLKEVYAQACDTWKVKIRTKFPQVVSNVDSVKAILTKLGQVYSGEYATLYTQDDNNYIRIPLPIANSEWSLAAFKWAAEVCGELHKLGLDAYPDHSAPLTGRFIYVRYVQQ